MFDRKRHYEMYYRYDKYYSEEDVGKIVNGLFEKVMRNDKEAVDEVLKIISSQVYFLACSRLDATGNLCVEDVDDVMQNICIEILKSSFRGVPSYVNDEKYYGYLIGISENTIRNYRRRNNVKIIHEAHETDEIKIEDIIDRESEVTRVKELPEDMFIYKENVEVQKTIIATYLDSLMNSSLPPQHLLTFCYAVIIPLIIKSSCDVELKSIVGELSKRQNGKPGSRYDRENNCLEGDINRESIILMKWAFSAMYGMSVSELNREYLSIYEREKIYDIPFCWGTRFELRLEEEEDEIKIKDIVICDKYKKNNIKNWPQRVMDKLVSETEERINSLYGIDFKKIMDEIF